MRRLLQYLLVFTALNGCRDKYNSPVHAAPAGYLVVEGYISNDTGATRIHLTRSVQLDSAHSVAETGATILVEAMSGGTVATLTEGIAGYYSGNPVITGNSDQYRIHISTSSGMAYVSDYSPTRATPPIDSVSWTAGPDVVNIYVTTHDPAAQTINYHWTFDETWKYTSAYESKLIYRSPKFIFRDSSHQIYTCYRSATSTTVQVASSAGLAKDEISLFPIAQISYGTSTRLSNNYSINVKQQAASIEALNYYTILAKNTEQLGSIFDAQPSSLSGNVHSVSDAGELVLGFIECSAKTEKRIFISRAQLPDVPYATGHDNCDTEVFASVPVGKITDSLFIGEARTPISGIADNSKIDNLVYSNARCVDCQVQGGTTIKPAFWP